MQSPSLAWGANRRRGARDRHCLHLDICVLTEKTIPRGDILLRTIPLGGLRTLDSHTADDKIVAANRRRHFAAHDDIRDGEAAAGFEYQLRAKETLKVVVPFTLLLIFLLLYFNTKSVAKTLIILVAVPFSAVGAIWLLYLCC